ncbi:MAG: respiratory nitrate reductase subunit gamma [Candidatus Obscuribacterales bacterium]|nr:respiratory nitrate reductase subunit gamma [Cyanobacteria bacterium HKST-UBA01]MCB9471652.1 respiratory nitrate reductase subunit gamma [Candidatus Obscuribacterales bacterium]
MNATVIDTLFYIVLPYLAVLICIIGSIYRIRREPMTYSSLSSQFLEARGLMWGSLPWHIGITLILLGHVIPFLFPGQWNALVSNKPVLLTIECLGYGLSALCLFGLVVLAARRLVSSRVQKVTTGMDMLVLLLLVFQVILGMMTAMSAQYGSLWCTGTTVPYLWSLVTMTPDVSYIQDLPHVMKAHILGAWLIVLLVPFSRLIHMFSVPLSYLTRPPQNVIWTNPRHEKDKAETFAKDDARRHFIKASCGVLGGITLLSIGALDKIGQFFFGPRLSFNEETELMESKLKRLELTAEQRKLEVERRENEFILVSALKDLDPIEGKYFIDYQMQPAIAFKREDGLPQLISAKCTHLGCTVGNKADNEGKILCPCHVSYFDIKTGVPNQGAPAEAPLPILGWVVLNPKGEVLASREKSGEIKGKINNSDLDSAQVFIRRADFTG